MSDKWITITFLSSKRRLMKNMDRANKALEKAAAADMEEGTCKIDNVEIKIETTFNGMC